jgi:hypothetical protein
MNKTLRDFRKNNEETLQKSQDDFEKQLSFISAGTLGLSMFLIDKVVKDITIAHYKWSLIVSWSLLGLTLIINLFSHFLAIRFNYMNIEEIDCSQYDDLKSIKRNTIIKFINICTLSTLILGIVFLILFMSLNILKNA